MQDLNGFRHSGHPVFALSLGDPAGIGPEITLKAYRNSEFRSSVIVVGDAAVLQKEASLLNMNCTIHKIDHSTSFSPGAVNIFDCGIVSSHAYKKGKAQKKCGMAAYKYVEHAIALAIEGVVDGVITNPINKEALSLAGIQFPGHTEIFAEKTATQDYSMLFFLNNVGVAHVTTHCSLQSAIHAVTQYNVVKHIKLLDLALKGLGFKKPRIAVSGLNPHAGENGLFGDEEIRYIYPAISEASQSGIDVKGPFPPDTVFMRAFKGEFDGVVSMLHDHGFVALKSMDFAHGVNITVGLPIIRTSVGHGTAFDIAGKGIADHTSLLAAYDAAVRLYHNRGLHS